MRTFKNFQFVNLIHENFPIHLNPDNKLQDIRGYLFSEGLPEPAIQPQLLKVSSSVAEILEIAATEFQNKQLAAEYLTGTKLIPGSKPFSHCYCGYQFGNWAGQLGDGRALSIGQILTEKGKIMEIQLKGSGKTPYSRFADGKAVLRSSIREFLCSEAMAGLGIPTTRALSLSLTGETVIRDPLYNGHVEHEKGAIVVRVAESFLRFGSFEVCNNDGPSAGLSETMLPGLMQYLLKQFYQDLWNADLILEEKVFNYFKKITQQQAELVAQWQSIGFVHGVLNTDNMSAIGLTIDYGPFQFQDHFDKFLVSNFSDKTGHYNYSKQAQAMKWNLQRYAEALKSLSSEERMKNYLESEFSEMYETKYYSLMQEKLGLSTVRNKKSQKLVEDLLEVMHYCGSEYTNIFRFLATFSEKSDTQEFSKLLYDFSQPRSMELKKLKPSVPQVKLEILKQMLEKNPSVGPQLGIDLEFILREEQKIKSLEVVSQQTEAERQQIHQKQWISWLQNYQQALIDERTSLGLDFENPAIVLKNYILQMIIRLINEGDTSCLEETLNACKNPFQEPILEFIKLEKRSPSWGQFICVSCSS